MLSKSAGKFIYFLDFGEFLLLLCGIQMILTLVDMMERHIDRIRIFKAQASPAYMSLTYINDPVSHAFDCTKKAALGISREPEFKSDFEQIQDKCRHFAVDLLHACRNSKDVEIILDDPRDKSRNKIGVRNR